MITVFRENGKPLIEIESKSEMTVILAAKESFSLAGAVCGGCGAAGFLRPHSGYTRWLIVLEDGIPGDKELELARCKCGVCGKTHVMAPGEAVIPYARHSLGFIAAAIMAYAKRLKPVREIADEFQITVRTLYEWKKRFRDHCELLMGKTAAGEEITGHMENLRQSAASRFRLFTETYRLGFLQGKRGGVATRSFTLRGFLAPCPGRSP